MTLNNLMTPFERRRVIEYGKDGNKVVRHWYDVQHVLLNNASACLTVRALSTE